MSACLCPLAVSAYIYDPLLLWLLADIYHHPFALKIPRQFIVSLISFCQNQHQLNGCLAAFCLKYSFEFYMSLFHLGAEHAKLL